MIAINFQLEKYNPFKEKDISILSCNINVTVTSHNDVPYFRANQTAYICWCCKHLNYSHFNVVLCAEVVVNVNRRTKMKFDSTWTSFYREIDVDLMSVCRKKHIVYRNILLERLSVPCG